MCSKRNFSAKLVFHNSLIIVFILVVNAAGIADVTKAYDYLDTVMDQYHNSFDVYTDQDSGGNHFFPSGWMGTSSLLTIDTACTENCYAGTTCIKLTFTPDGDKWTALYWQNPDGNWGTIPGAGYNLTGATKLSFWAKGQKGGERVDFFCGGISGSSGDSFSTTRTGYIQLTNQWQRYTITLSGKELSFVIGGFGVGISSPSNPTGAVFYLDDIKYNKSRLGEPRFILSYESKTNNDPDKQVKNICYCYDNALALIDYVARGKSWDMNRAKLIADAFVLVQQHERLYTDGRLRDAYMSGDLLDHLTGKARLSGWWDFQNRKWMESGFSTSAGNMAWVMIALLTYYESEGGQVYLDTAIQLGEWIEANTKDIADGVGGFTGGYEGNDGYSVKVSWKSTEHNIDLYAAFIRLYNITKNDDWQKDALLAKKFVDAMWNSGENHYWTGTESDGQTPAMQTIPLDVQPWSILSLGQAQNPLIWAQNHCQLTIDGFTGFDFNTDLDGIWFEGTAQMATAYKQIGNVSQANIYLEELRKAQEYALNANGKGIVAASHDGVSTGFGWQYFSRNHVGATSWYILAELGYNPYWNQFIFSKYILQPPADVSATDGTYIDKVQISWNVSSEATSYEIWRNTDSNSITAIKIADTVNLFYDDTTAIGGIIYWYWVKARNSLDVSEFNSFDTGYHVSRPPTDISATDGTYTDKVQISWNASSDATSYEIWRNTDSNSITASKIAETVTSPYEDTSAIAGRTYWYWVKAKNSGSISDFSSVDSGYHNLQPPTYIWVLNDYSKGMIEVTWSYWSASSDVTSYEIWRNTNSDSATASKIAEAVNSPYDDTSAIAGITYWYWLKSKNSYNSSDFSSSDSGYRFVSGTMNIRPFTVKAGIYRGLDSISFSGQLGATASTLLAATEIQIYISAANKLSPLDLTFPINTTTFKRGKYTAKSSNNSFTLDTKTGKMTFSAKNADLTGLACPITVTIQIGSYSAQVKLDESIVNGAKKLCPIQLMMGVKNSLTVAKAAVKRSTKLNTDSLTISGTFTIAGSYSKSDPLAITLGGQTFTVPGSQFVGKNRIESCKTASNEGPLVTAKLDFAKCTYSISVRNASIKDIGNVNFGINCFGVSLEGLTTAILK